MTETSTDLQKLAKRLKPYMARYIAGGAGGSAGVAGGAPSPHEFEGVHHTGTLNFNTIDEVNISGAVDGQTLYYDGTAAKWQNTSLLSVFPASGNVSINGTATITGVTTITGIADGGLTSYDLKVGDTTTPDYGMIQLGNFAFGRTSYSVGAIDLDGAILFRNIGGPVTSQIEFIFTESVGNTARFALPKSAVGNATYNPRSMFLAGPAPADTAFVTVAYWQTQGIFHNLVCDTSATGADLGVQNDLEVEGDIFVDSMKESTTAAGITFDNTVIHSNIATGTAPFTISSTTKVANLNVDSLDDQSGAYYLDSVNFTGTDWTDLTDSGVTTLHTHSGLPPGPHGLGSHDDVVITAVADNEVLAYDSGTTDWINQTAAEAGLSAVGHTHAHSAITGVTSDQHHAQAHALSGGDHTGDLAYTQLDSLVDTTGGGSASMISGALHVHTGADGSSAVSHSDLSGVTSDQHHAQSHDLDSHSDVVISGTPADNELLAWNTGTSRWINQTAAEAGLSASGHTHAHSAITGISSDQHHAQVHALAGANHTASGLSVGQTIRASGATTFGWAVLQHSDLGSVTSDQHHAQSHDVDSHSDVVITAVADNEVLAWNTGTSRWINQTASEAGLATSGHSHAHGDLSGVTSDQHHAQAHALSGGDHTGDLVYTQLDAIVDTTGGGSASLISAAVHAHTGADGSSQIDSANFTGTDWTDLTDSGATTLHTHTGLAPGPHSLGSHDDVVITTVADNELLTYDSGSGDWINQVPWEVGIPVNAGNEIITGSWSFDNATTEFRNPSDTTDYLRITAGAGGHTINFFFNSTSEAFLTSTDTGFVTLSSSGAQIDVSTGAGDTVSKLIRLIGTVIPPAANTEWFSSETFISTTDHYWQLLWQDNAPTTFHYVRIGESSGITFNQDKGDVDTHIHGDGIDNIFMADASTGWVGIGGVPTDDFQVIVEGSLANIDLYEYQTRAGAGIASFTSYLAGGTAASPTRTLSGDAIYFGGRGYQETTSDWTLTRAYLALVATEDYTSTVSGMRMDFATTVTGGSTRTVKMTLLDGLQLGTPTGGDKGGGTINAAADIYKNDTAYTNPDYVLEHHYRGSIFEFVDSPGASEYRGLEPLNVTAEFMESNLHLPWIQRDKPSGIFDRGDMLLVGQETLMLYVIQLENRIAELESKS